MDVISIPHFYSYERRFIQVFSQAPFANIFSTYFTDLSISLYSRMVLEMVGLASYINQLSIEDAKIQHKALSRISVLIGFLVENSTVFNKNAKTRQLGEVIKLLSEKITQNLELLEDVMHPHYNYQMTFNGLENDWNQPENDHWDNY
jgi:hypothetical protein